MGQMMYRMQDGTLVPLGTPGPQGPTGATGATGPGVAAGGTTGQVLRKASATDYDTSWFSGLPTTSTDNTVARFDGTGGALQDSGVTIDDNGRLEIQDAPSVVTDGKLIINTDVSPIVYLNNNGAGYSRIRAWSARGTAASRTASQIDDNLLMLDARGFSGTNYRGGASVVLGVDSTGTISDTSLPGRFEVLTTPDGSTTQTTRLRITGNGKVTISSVGASAGIELGNNGPRMMVGTGGPSGIAAPVGSTWRQTDANSSHGSLTGLLWNKVGTGTTEGTDWLVDYEGRFVTYTPTIAASSGSFTTVSGTGTYTRFGKVAIVKIKVTITTNGTAAGAVVATLPSGCNSASSEWQGSGRADVSNKMMQVRGYSSTQVQMQDYTGAYPGASGESLRIALTYEIA